MRGHRLDLLSLLSGLVFVAVGGTHLLGFDLATGSLAVARAWPLLLVAAGVAILAGLTRRTDDD